MSRPLVFLSITAMMIISMWEISCNEGIEKNNIENKEHPEKIMGSNIPKGFKHIMQDAYIKSRHVRDIDLGPLSERRRCPYGTCPPSPFMT